MTDEDHLAAAAWNILSIMHHEELGQMEFDDMPHYLSKKDDFVSVLEIFKSLPKEEQIKIYKAFEELFCKEEKDHE